MKAVIVLVLFALISGVCCRHYRSNALETNDQSQSSEEHSLAPKTRHPSSSEEASNVGNHHYGHSLAQPRVGSGNLSSNSGSVDLFRTKVLNRLNSSTKLANQPEKKRVLLEIAENLYKTCNAPNYANHSCLGIVTGQVMRLIAQNEKDNN